MNRSRVTADLASHGNIFVDIANDRVGIGTTQPTHKVDLAGSFKLHDGSGYGNHITFTQNPPTITFPTGPLANLSKTPTLVFGDRTSGGDFKIYQDHYSLHMRHLGPSGFHIGSQASHLVISGSNGSNAVQPAIRIDPGATEGVKLYSGGTQRFETVGYGVTVLGTTETQELNVTGVSTHSGSAYFYGNFIELNNGADSQYVLNRGGTQLFSIRNNAASGVHINTQNSALLCFGVSTGTNNGTVESTLSINSSGNVGIDNQLASEKLHLADNKKLALGSSADLKIYHDGSHSYIDDTGTGNLKLRSNNFRVSNADESKLSATFVPSGAAELYHNNAKKFETTSAGGTLTGRFTTGSTTNLATNNIASSTQLLVSSLSGNNNFVDLTILGGRTGRSMVKFGDQDNYNVGSVQYFHNDNSINFFTNGGTTSHLTIASDGAISVSGTVDGRDLATDGAKLDGIEASATADQTASEILTLIKTVDGAGSGLDADTLDGLSSASFLRSDTADTASGDISFAGGAGAVTVNAASDIRIAGGTWTGEYTGGIKIQPDASNSYIQYHGGMYFRNSGGANRVYFDSAGNTTIVGNLTVNGGISGSGASITGVNATTLDSIDSGSFLRSDADDSVSAYTNQIRFPSNSAIPTSSGSQASLEVFSGNGSGTDAFMAFHTSGDFACYFGLDGGINDIAVGGWSMGNISNRVWHAGNDGSGSGLDADTLDGVDGANYVRTNQNTTITSDLFIGGGGGGITVNAGSDIRFTNGDWTGNVNGTAKIQHHSNYLYISGGTAGIIFRENNANRWVIDGSGNFDPGADSSYDIGQSDKRVRDIYADTYYGDGSNLTNITSTTINSNADNRVITGSGTANTLNGETALTFNANAELHIGSGSSDQKLKLFGTNPYIRFMEGSTEKGFFQWHSGGYFRIKNQEDNSVIRIKDSLDFSLNDSTFYTIWHSGNDGSGSGLDADTLDGLNSSSFCRTDTTFTFNASGNDINLDYDNNRNIVRIQRSGSERFMLGASGNEIKINTSNGGFLTFGTNLLPQSDNAYDLGSSSKRWRNLYTNDLHLSNEGHSNDVDGTWGDWTLQEGESEVYMINNRTGKKYAMMLREV